MTSCLLLWMKKKILPKGPTHKGKNLLLGQLIIFPLKVGSWSLEGIMIMPPRIRRIAEGH